MVRVGVFRVRGLKARSLGFRGLLWRAGWPGSGFTRLVGSRFHVFLDVHVLMLGFL